MIDIKLIRENKDLVKENIKKKFQDKKLPLVDEVYDIISINYLEVLHIKEYLKQGINTINFAPLTKENKGKTINYRVELL